MYIYMATWRELGHQYALSPAAPQTTGRISQKNLLFLSYRVNRVGI